MKLTTNKMVKTGILGAIATVLMFLEFPIFFLPPFLQMDFSDLPAIIASFSLGPVCGLLVEAIKNVIHYLTKGDITGGVGQIANFIIGASLVVPAGLYYYRHRTKRGALIGLIIGSVSMIVLAFLANYYILIPFYIERLNFPIEALVKMSSKFNPFIKDRFTLVMFGVTPFNILKAVLLSIITVLIYKPLSPILKK